MVSIRSIVRKPWVIATGVVFVVVMVVGGWLFQPWKIFVDEKVDEAFPVATADLDEDLDEGTAEAPTADSGTSTSAPAGGGVTAPVAPPSSEPEFTELSRGEFAGIEHNGSGDALLLELADDTRYLRFEGFETENGPDLFVYLSTAPPDAPQGDFDDDFVDLGMLKGNIGDQNYEIAADVDLSKYNSVVVWCRRFSVAFTAAPVDV